MENKNTDKQEKTVRRVKNFPSLLSSLKKEEQNAGREEIVERLKYFFKISENQDQLKSI